MDNGLVLTTCELNDAQILVLILVVVDNGLVRHKFMTHPLFVGVLILVVVDNGLVQFEGTFEETDGKESLNPCCSGQWSRTLIVKVNVLLLIKVVLILVVVDNGLVLGAKVDIEQTERSAVLILVVVDNGLVPI